jgi:hypothetical protein
MQASHKIFTVQLVSERNFLQRAEQRFAAETDTESSGISFEDLFGFRV